jgi:hypothetical protein
MSVMLLAAIPRTRAAALGGLAFGSLVIVAFVLTYYAVFTFGRPRWITHPIGGLVRVNGEPTPAATPARSGMHERA